MPHHHHQQAHRHHIVASTLVVLALALLTQPTTTQSREISNWNLDNVVTEAEPRESGEVYHSYICAKKTNPNDSFSSCEPNGAIVWTEDKNNVQAEGMKVVSSSEEGYCIMTKGKEL